MKKIFLIAMVLSTAFLAKSQVIELEKVSALKLVKDSKDALNLSQLDIDNSIISSTYKNKFAGTTMVYLQQTFKGVPIYNQLLTLAFKDGKLVSKSGNFISGVADIANVKSEVPYVNAKDALITAIADRKLLTNENPIEISTKESGKKFEFGEMGVAKENITTALMWFPTEIGKKTLRLGWQVYIIPKKSSDYWLVNVDATNKSIISVSNLTVYCNWHGTSDHLQDSHSNSSEKNITNGINGVKFFDENNVDTVDNNLVNSPALVNSASYRVIPFPAESPIHPGGTPSLVTNPWSLSGAGNAATSLNWHSVGTTNYDITRGNNVWAQEDRNGNNGSSVTQVISSTSPDPLTFDFVPDFAVDPTQITPISNQQFNTTNLFYWNNIIHDLSYLYGFDEASRNFQANNLGRGGAEGDYVFADAQDGSDTDNANFSTPPDGSNGRMQMFLWTTPNPAKDGDVDNGIIVHEYGHGISNRLTGTGSGCLGNAEQMGEGWSDYFALMYTQNWASSNLNTGFTTPRGIGTYAVNQSITGLGIRTQKYCTNFAVNNRSYAASISSSQHERGEIWCATLWDMTWGIINQIGSINQNLFNPNGVGGNSIALKLVIEGMKLQPCSPGFISARDAILQADEILYGGTYRCTILEAFRRRGMGLGASQGSSGNINDQIPSFTNNGGATLQLLQTGIVSVTEGQNITYTNRVISDKCTGFTNYTLTDTLPANVTYVSGGSYNAASRVVSFSITQAAGTTVDYNFVVKVNSGTYFTPNTLLNETVPNAIPATWTASTPVPTNGNLWTVSSLQANSTPNAFFCENEIISTDKILELAREISLPSGASVYPKLSFSHRYNTEDGWDGGVVEISTNGGLDWTDLGANMISNKYNSVLGEGAGNNLSNRNAFTGSIPTFINTSINLSPYNGQNAKIRFRFSSDDNTAGTGSPTGWFVDDINIINAATVSMRSSFFNASMERVMFADSFMLISPDLFAPPAISLQPQPITACLGSNATFVSQATGIGTTYSWEVSTNAGLSWTTIAPTAGKEILTLPAVTLAMNNNLYRVRVTNTLTLVTATSNAVKLNIAELPAAPITTSISYCQGGIAASLSNAVTTGTNLMWYLSASGGSASTIAPIPSTDNAGITSYYVTQTLNNCQSPKAQILVTVNPKPAAPIVVPAVSYCQGTLATALSATGANLLWYSSANSTTGNAEAPIPTTTSAGSINYYVSQTLLGCEGARATILVNVSEAPAITLQPQSITTCSTSATFTANATGSAVNYQWQKSTDGGLIYTNLSGEINNVLNLTGLTEIEGGNKYRLVITSGSCASITSNVVNVKVGIKPTILLNVMPVANFNPYVNGGLFTKVSPVGNYLYQWKRNNVILTNSGTSITKENGLLDDFGSYIVTATDLVTGCAGVSNEISVNDIEETRDQLFIIPNPTTGLFRVSFYNNTIAAQNYSINIYNENGLSVIVKNITLTGRYGFANVDLTAFASGTYIVILRDASGNKVASNKVVKY
jgi:hypothetical protein